MPLEVVPKIHTLVYSCIYVFCKLQLRPQRLYVCRKEGFLNSKTNHAAECSETTKSQPSMSACLDDSFPQVAQHSRKVYTGSLGTQLSAYCSLLRL